MATIAFETGLLLLTSHEMSEFVEFVSGGWFGTP